VPAVSPVSELENAPVPVPSLVCGFAVVGFDAVDQHTPRAVTDAPPSEETLPPLVAAVVVIPVAAVVVTAGNVTEFAVVKVRSEPYAVPCEFVAYARMW
jgi:hypothetical protein